MATKSLYTQGGTEYWLTVTGSVSGSTISAQAHLEPRYDGGAFASNNTGTLTISIEGVTSNSTIPHSVSKSNPADIYASASVSNGTYTIKADWNVGSGPGYKPLSGYITMTVTVNTTIYRTVTFDLGGYGSNFTRSVANNTKVERPYPDPTYEGYIFVDWYSNSGLTTLFDFNTLITSNTTIYAKWKEEEQGLLRLWKSSEWKEAIPYVYKSGEWKQSIAYAFKSGDWRKGE